MVKFERIKGGQIKGIAVEKRKERKKEKTRKFYAPTTATKRAPTTSPKVITPLPTPATLFKKTN